MNADVLRAGVNLANDFQHRIREAMVPFYEKGDITDETPEGREFFTRYILSICAMISAHEITSIARSAGLKPTMEIFAGCLENAIIQQKDKREKS